VLHVRCKSAFCHIVCAAFNIPSAATYMICPLGFPVALPVLRAKLKPYRLEFRTVAPSVRCFQSPTCLFDFLLGAHGILVAAMARTLTSKTGLLI